MLGEIIKSDVYVHIISICTYIYVVSTFVYELFISNTHVPIHDNVYGPMNYN